MGLFHRREETQTEVLYSVGIGLEKTKLIIGLGNPGAKYAGTRHNIGFAVLDALAEAENGSWAEKKSLKCAVCELRIGKTRVILCKPTTFMNLSGEAAQAIQHFYKLTNQDTVAVYDELDIPFGQIRSRLGGSAAGHNGVKSLIAHLGEDFGRIRIGIASDISKKAESSDFVLGKFTKAEQGSLKLLLNEANAMLNEYIFGDGLSAETRSFIG